MAGGMNTYNRDEMEALIKQAQNGDNGSLEQIYILYYTPIYRYLYGRLSHKGLAEDLAQTTFLKIFQALPTINADKVHPIAYFYTVARNTMIDHFRKKKHEPVFDDEQINVEDMGMATDGEAKQREQKDVVEAGLKHLNEEQREIVTLRFMNDMSTKEIADVLGKSDDAIRQTLSRSIKILREHFEE